MINIFSVLASVSSLSAMAQVFHPPVPPVVLNNFQLTLNRVNLAFARTLDSSIKIRLGTGVTYAPAPEHDPSARIGKIRMNALVNDVLVERSDDGTYVTVANIGLVLPKEKGRALFEYQVTPSMLSNGDVTCVSEELSGKTAPVYVTAFQTAVYDGMHSLKGSNNNPMPSRLGGAIFAKNNDDLDLVMYRISCLRKWGAVNEGMNVLAKVTFIPNKYND